MFTIKTLLSQSSFRSLKPPFYTYNFPRSLNSSNSTAITKSRVISLAAQRPIFISAQLETPSNGKKNRRPLDVLFKEALGLCERIEVLRIQSENKGDDEDKELKSKLWDLEMELRQLKVEKSEEKEREFGGSKSKFKHKSLLAHITNTGGEKENSLGKREDVILKEMSPDMQVLLKQLYDRGYFKNVNFLPGNVFDVSYFDNAYARDYLKCAVERFGEDNQEITKWLSGSDLKTIALFGCPSQRKREVFAAKRLRIFFDIPEETVCGKCTLKESCKFVNQSVWNVDSKMLRLDLLMRLLSTYSQEDIPHQLKLTDDVKACVSRLMHDVMNLSKST